MSWDDEYAKRERAEYLEKVQRIRAAGEPTARTEALILIADVLRDIVYELCLRTETGWGSDE